MAVLTLTAGMPNNKTIEVEAALVATEVVLHVKAHMTMILKG